MKTLILLVVLTLTIASPAFAQMSPVANSVYFTNIEAEYKSFAEIQPILVNNSGQAIHLKFLYPNGAKLKRLNEETGEWELGGTGIGCGTGAKPVEIAAGESPKIVLDWEMSTDDFEKPKFFELQDRETHRPLRGTYKIFMPYALEKWFFNTKPKIYYVESTEFRINPKAKARK